MWLIILIACLCTACSQPITYFEGIAMHMPYKVMVADSISKKKCEQITAAIVSLFESINQTYNNWNVESEISKFNQAKSCFTPSPALLHLFLQIDELYHISEGRFDPTVEPVAMLWKQAALTHLKPDPTTLEQACKAVGWNQLHIQAGTIYKDTAHIALDLSAIAKGLAVDLLVEAIAQLGIHNFYVEWGGEIKVKGTHPTGRAWKIALYGINQPIDLTDHAVATSGDYLQTWIIEDTTYCHIIDPRSKTPITQPYCTSVSVEASSCMLADAIATTLMLFEDENLLNQWMKQHFPQLRYWVVKPIFS